MIPTISPEFTIDLLYQAYLDALQKTAFSGEVRCDYASRLAVATDNSIYQMIPQAVIFPKNTADIAFALTLGAEERFQKIKFSPRGGGVAANGQSLSCSIIIDCSKYMRNILEINLLEGWVKVESGVVQDQLNEYLLPFGMHFAPEISPSNRATIGGMINTDACGNGQKQIGRTSDHVVALKGVLSDGSIFSSHQTDLPFYKEIESLLASEQDEIVKHFPKMPRTLSGYNLLKSYQENRLNFNYLLCGSEGTLAVISECTLKLTPLPKYKKLVVLQYHHFDDALRALDITSNIKPLVIECIDETLLELARRDAIYFYVKEFIENKDEKTGAINLVEFIADDEKWLNDQIEKLCDTINNNKHQPYHAIGYYVAHEPADIKKCWELRKKSVGLISKNKVGTRRPIPFIEDTAVPPEHLVDYIQAFKQLLDSYQLSYGMYGHVDAGCVHVRPALDLQQKEDRDLHQVLSEQIVALVKKYHGVMWGEHGLGYRAEFNEEFFGKKLYDVVRKIKTTFDPLNKLNPGKIAIPFGCDEELVQLSGPLRADFDKQIPSNWQDEYPDALVCNGNGACFNYSTKDYMCPSFKVTKDRIHSPKGRAAVMREWLRQLKRLDFQMNSTVKPFQFFKKCFTHQNKNDFSNEVFSAFNGCLGCKACTSQCPLNVDIPDLKSRFLNLYYQRYFRPFRDYCIASIEKIANFQSYFPRISNTVMQWQVSQWFIKKFVKMVNVPKISALSLKKELKKRGILSFNLDTLLHLTKEKKDKSVILLQDIFTSVYRPEILLKTYDLFTLLGFSVYVAPFFVNGKSYHTQGFLNRFHRIATRNIGYLNRLAETNIALVGLDPSMTLTYRDEYRKIKGDIRCHFNVFLPQEWLHTHLSAMELTQRITNKRPEKTFSLNSLSNDINPLTNKTYFLLSHCTEKTMCIAAEKEWIAIFAAFGLTLTPLSVGCCGMSGAYGHEVEHVGLSRELFKMSWQPHLQKLDDEIVFVTTGYSCRSQVSRFQGMQLLHPLEVLSHI
jgi:FAD/FMN-containing dehydrogenase/Fe-S oxidoreductase